MKQCAKCGNNFPSSVKQDGRKKVFSSRKYCLRCSPFGKHAVRGRARGVCLNVACELCEKPLEPAKTANRRRCNPCMVKIHRIANKVKAAKLLGGACAQCGWIPSHLGEFVVFDFHHKGGDKEGTLSQMFNLRWERIESELRKCELLCHRCHRIRHSPRDTKTIAAVRALLGSET